LILPSDVWLVNLTASASPHSSTGAEEGGENGGSASGIRASAPGPALELSGCATGQEAVAGFVTALKDIDGVTRVGVETSQLSDKESGAGDAGGSGGEGGEDCRTREFIAKFEIVAAFDAAPVPPSTEGAEVAAAPEPEEASSESSEEGG
jgi:hypothetical protein